MVGAQRFIELTFVLTLLIWLAAAGWFANRYEEKTALRDNSQPYRLMLSDFKQDRTSDFVIVSGDKAIGDTTMRITTMAFGYFEISNRFRARLQLLGIEAEYFILSTMIVTPRYELDSLKMSFESAGMRYDLVGRRVMTENEEDKFSIQFMAGDTTIADFTLDAPKDYMMSDTLMPLFKTTKPQPGKTWISKLIDPFTKKIREFKFTMLDLDELPGGDENLIGYPIRMEYANYTYMTYVDDNGEVLWEEAPFGITLVRKDIAIRMGFIEQN